MKGAFAALPLLAIALLLSGCTLQPETKPFEGVTDMKLLSEDIQNGEEMPSQFTCDGENISPELHWEGAPAEAKSFALTLRDPDAPGGTFDHWLVCNIPADTASISQGEVPSGAKQVANDFGKEDYGGPCPPSGTHRYIFKLYALDVEAINPANKQDFFHLVEQHRIAETELMAPYKRK